MKDPTAEGIALIVAGSTWPAEKKARVLAAVSEMGDRRIRAGEAARLLGVSRRTFFAQVAAGSLPVRRIKVSRNAVFYLESDVMEHVRGNGGN